MLKPLEWTAKNGDGQDRARNGRINQPVPTSTVLFAMSMEFDRNARAASLAALSICEALALALAEHSILSHDALCAAIDDAIAVHKDAAAASPNAEVHLSAARLAARIKASIEDDSADPAPHERT
jgi:hypothetical protein